MKLIKAFLRKESEVISKRDFWYITDQKKIGKMVLGTPAMKFYNEFSVI